MRVQRPLPSSRRLLSPPFPAPSSSQGRCPVPSPAPSRQRPFSPCGSSHCLDGAAGLWFGENRPVTTRVSRALGVGVGGWGDPRPVGSGSGSGSGRAWSPSLAWPPSRPQAPRPGPGPPAAPRPHCLSSMATRAGGAGPHRRAVCPRRPRSRAERRWGAGPDDAAGALTARRAPGARGRRHAREAAHRW